jgi:dTDP-glucose pyrophosphorylase
LSTRDLALVMPMAGKGSRFQRGGVLTPKPLVDLQGHPFFWWAAESVRRAVRVREIVFVVLADHVERFRIDARIRAYYPRAQVIALSEVTSGAAETAAIGVNALTTRGPFAVNDCDHAFLSDGLSALVERLRGRTEGALLGFCAGSPGYSYVQFDGERQVIGTVEKRVVSEFAIAGCYLFADPRRFTERLAEYRHTCPYEEPYLSGVYNDILRAGGEVLFQELARHVAFGTPEEYEQARRADLSSLRLDDA